MLQGGPDLDPVVLDEATEEILGSQFFRSSAQCSSLFRYIVENTRMGRDSHLRERVIGAEVFDRAPDYDTGNDHIVRSRASEVRKRLAQFYQERGSTTGIKIGIPSGSYRATFEFPVISQIEIVPDSVEHPTGSESRNFPEAQPSAQEVGHTQAHKSPPLPAGTSARTIRFGRWLMLGFIVLLCAGAGAWSVHRYRFSQSTLETFWGPLVNNRKPVLIYCGGGFVYKLSDPFLDRYKKEHNLKESRRLFFADLKHGDLVDGADLVPDHHFVPFGDLASTARIVTSLARFNTSYDLRYGDDLAITEFRSSPVILIGGFNNSWALRITRNLRFTLMEDDQIVDQWHRERSWVQKADPDNSTRDDYAVISRIVQSDTGNFVLSIAGIRMYGTRAASDLISDPTQIEHILRGAPKGWEKKNMQIVIHTRTLNDIPVAVNVEAIHFW